jgi:hypothetical protein
VAELAVVDTTWLALPAAEVSAALSERSRWAAWWPGLRVDLDELRGAEGLRWTVLSAARGRMSGEMEFWLQPGDDGVLAHYLLRLDPARAAPALRPRARERLVRDCRAGAKRAVWEVGDRLDPGRLARVSAPGR